MQCVTTRIRCGDGSGCSWLINDVIFIYWEIANKFWGFIGKGHFSTMLNFIGVRGGVVG
jgi:hypothetical protein